VKKVRLAIAHQLCRYMPSCSTPIDVMQSTQDGLGRDLAGASRSELMHGGLAGRALTK
jgi:hypothetical protein